MIITTVIKALFMLKMLREHAFQLQQSGQFMLTFQLVLEQLCVYAVSYKLHKAKALTLFQTFTSLTNELQMNLQAIMFISNQSMFLNKDYIHQVSLTSNSIIPYYKIRQVHELSLFNCCLQYLPHQVPHVPFKAVLVLIRIILDL